MQQAIEDLLSETEGIGYEGEDDRAPSSASLQMSDDPSSETLLLLKKLSADISKVKQDLEDGGAARRSTLRPRNRMSAASGNGKDVVNSPPIQYVDNSNSSPGGLHTPVETEVQMEVDDDDDANLVQKGESSLNLKQGATDLPRKSSAIDMSSSNLRQSTTDLPRKSSAIDMSSSNLRQSTTDLPRKSSAIDMSSSNLRQSTTDLPRKSSAIDMSSSNLKQSTTDLPRKSSAIDISSSNHRKSTTALSGQSSAIGMSLSNHRQSTTALPGQSSAINISSSSHRKSTTALSGQSSAINISSSNHRQSTTALLGQSSAINISSSNHRKSTTVLPGQSSAINISSSKHRKSTTALPGQSSAVGISDAGKDDTNNCPVPDITMTVYNETDQDDFPSGQQVTHITSEAYSSGSEEYAMAIEGPMARPSQEFIFNLPEFEGYQEGKPDSKVNVRHAREIEHSSSSSSETENNCEYVVKSDINVEIVSDTV